MTNKLKTDAFKNVIKDLVQGVEEHLGRKITASDIAVVKPEPLAPTGEFNISVVDKATFAKKFTEEGPIFDSELKVVNAEEMQKKQVNSPSRPKMR